MFADIEYNYERYYHCISEYYCEMIVKCLPNSTPIEHAFLNTLQFI